MNRAVGLTMGAASLEACSAWSCGLSSWTMQERWDGREMRGRRAWARSAGEWARASPTRPDFLQGLRSRSWQQGTTFFLPQPAASRARNRMHPDVLPSPLCWPLEVLSSRANWTAPGSRQAGNYEKCGRLEMRQSQIRGAGGATAAAMQGDRRRLRRGLARTHER